jgi:BNR/Asp-box repeat
MEEHRGGDRSAVRRLALAAPLMFIALAAPARAQAPAGCDPSLPVVAHRAGGAVVALPAGDTRPVSCADPIGYPTSETTLAMTDAGTLIFSPAQTENTMARSTDGGATWSLTRPAGEQPTGFWNTVDPDVVADRRTGRVFWSHNTGPVRNETGLPQINPLAQGAGFYLAAAQGFQVYSSSDDGLTWTTADYSTAPTGDWEKLAVGPPPAASTGAAQPVGYPDIVYLCANSPLEVSGPGRLCYKSLDGGRTFSIAGYTSPSASNPPDICPPLNFDPPVVDSTGALYQPVTCQRADYVAVSRDEGSTYTWIPVPSAPTGNVDSGPYLQLAVDDADNLYGLEQMGSLIDLIVSRDHGQTWSPPIMVAGPGLTNVDLPALSAGAAGHVAITYYASGDPNAQLETAYITQTEDALDARPLFYTGALNDPGHPIFHDYGLEDAPRADFIGGSYDASGTRFWTGVVKQLGPPDANENIPTVGLAGTLEFTSTTPPSLP